MRLSGHRPSRSQLRAHIPDSVNSLLWFDLLVAHTNISCSVFQSTFDIHLSCVLFSCRKGKRQLLPFPLPLTAKHRPKNCRNK